VSAAEVTQVATRRESGQGCRHPLQPRPAV